MTEDLDIYRSAHLYIREHGDDAAIEGHRAKPRQSLKGRPRVRGNKGLVEVFSEECRYKCRPLATR